MAALSSRKNEVPKTNKTHIYTLWAFDEKHVLGVQFLKRGGSHVSIYVYIRQPLICGWIGLGKIEPLVLVRVTSPKDLETASAGSKPPRGIGVLFN